MTTLQQLLDIDIELPLIQAPIRAHTQKQGSGDFVPLWCGENASGCKEISATELTRELANS